MKKTVIREKVVLEIEKWMIAQKEIDLYISFSSKAVDFLCLMIENIEEDKSQFWDYHPLKNDAAQQFAITLIPNALDELKILSKFGKNYKENGDVKISSWEIWHSLSRIIDRFCFIPKDI
jgi:hypothetical protein